MGERILIVEDEATLATNMARYLGRLGHSVTTVGTGAEAVGEIDHRTFDLVITDLRLPDIDGLAVLDHVRASSPETVVLLCTAYASTESAIEALRRGAHDYMLKPVALADLQRKVTNIAEYKRLGRENARLRTLLTGDGEALGLLRRGGREMSALCDAIEKVAASPANVLVVGESGTGKELVARAIHERSDRAEGPFVTASVGAIPDSLLDSYLFGHERGAFAGAERPREGLFRSASGGTLFLDEVADLPLVAQGKLLRAVETKEILPLGADVGLKVDARIVAATHRDLDAMAQRGEFRSDLLYRVRVVTLRVPPLRERRGDIPELAEWLLRHHATMQRKVVTRIDAEALAVLGRYDLPGNVRELSNVIERAVILSTRDEIGPLDLPAEIGATLPPGAGPSSAPTSFDPERCELERATLAFQRDHIARVLDLVGGNREAAAKALGLSPATFYRYLHKTGLRGGGAEG